MPSSHIKESEVFASCLEQVHCKSVSIRIVNMYCVFGVGIFESADRHVILFIVTRFIVHNCFFYIGNICSELLNHVNVSSTKSSST